jgi:hypothetical protein
MSSIDPAKKKRKPRVATVSFISRST